mmetsp:Transcript_54872/g.112012  ORF Transcript_54872/g.112012 Transcript_54872/m.112012 type:complete len:245 (+) Transcript_54872:102-836(+)|eukprot:CAMPEP_0181299420 /NCGR_PEP_ID=MMETSP1101-20121128/6335_1 /TAXON_ID=46948 /ORGANISM="Rhodomonas abbreviata, Strain Caron Lab Isolate" /LENGTH=244 /DNA_ID=CAMNT_0023404565 /DNA_START=96 /DNA_END=830 /DNA_ORIENTATION=+
MEAVNNPSPPSDPDTAGTRGTVAGAGATDTIVLRINRSELRRSSGASAASMELDSDDTRRRLGEFLLVKTGVSPCSSLAGSPRASVGSPRVGSISGSMSGRVSAEGSPLPRRRSREQSRCNTPVSENGSLYGEDSFEDTDTEDHVTYVDIPNRERRKEKCRMRLRRPVGSNLIKADVSGMGSVEDDSSNLEHDASMNKKRILGSGLRRTLPEPVSSQDVADMIQGMSGLGEPMEALAQPCMQNP